MNIIITCAGKSERFKRSGIKTPKFLLPIGNTKIISKILDTYDDNDNFHLVITKKQSQDYPDLNSYLKKLKKNIYINIVKEHDKGPSFSASQAKSCKLKNDIIISYCDFLIEWNYKKFKREIFYYDFGITTFKGFHPSSFSGTLYCYLKSNNNEIINLREKKSYTKNPANEFASTGSYYFKSFDLFNEYYKKIICCKKIMTQYKEVYTSLLYLLAIKDKRKILNFEVNKFISLGTPRDYEEFLDWQNFFKIKN